MTNQAFDFETIADEDLQAAAGGYFPLPVLLITEIISESKKRDQLRELGKQGQVAECIEGVPSKACRRQVNGNQAFS